MKKLKTLSLIFIFVIFFCHISGAFGQENILKVHFIDVGEGDSILIEASKGKSALVDTGNLISGYNIVEYLRKNKIRKLDYLIITHPHPDHIGGIFFVLRMIEVGKIYDNGQALLEAEKLCDIYHWYREFVRTRPNYAVLKEGDILFLGDEIPLRVIWPQESPDSTVNFNSYSLVIKLDCGESSFLFTGDLDALGESGLLETRADLRADVLKIGHHGAEDTTTPMFLQAVSPRFAVVSVNAENVRGYPSPIVIKRLQDAGIKVYRTDKDGNIVFVMEEKEGKWKINKTKE